MVKVAVTNGTPDVVLHEVITRTKLQSSSASDSGISAEYNEYPACNSNGTSVHHDADQDEVDVVESDFVHLGSHVSSDTTVKKVEMKGIPRIVHSLVESPTDTPPLTPWNSNELESLVTAAAPPPSHIVGSLSAASSEVSFAELSSPSPSSSAHILDKRINEHLKKDKHWQPSGHHIANSHKHLVKMEVDIGNTLEKRHNVREEARQVLEMFLEGSLSVDPNFVPSGHYRLRSNRRRTPSPYAQKTDTPPPTPYEEPSGVTLKVPSPTRSSSPTATAPRLLSPIIAVESAAERSSDFSGLRNQRDSYYCALYDEDLSADECLDDVKDSIRNNIAIVSSESLEDGSGSPISLIPLEEGISTTRNDGGGFESTQVEATAEGVHIHRHKEVEETLSTSSTESMAGPDPEFMNRRKKSFFTRASERLRHALNRVQRSGSRSETEEEKYSVHRRPKKTKKKKKSPHKKADTDVVDVKVLQIHQHKIKLQANAQLSGNSTGLNADIWGESMDGGMFKEGVINKGKASTLPLTISKPDVPDKVKEKQREKEREKEREKREKAIKELMKEGKKRQKTNRSESTKSNESLFKKFSLRKPTKLDSPSGKSEKKTFSLGSIIKRSKSRKDSGDVSIGNESPRLLAHSSRNDTSSQHNHTRGEMLSQAQSLDIPQSAQQHISKSAEQIPTPDAGRQTDSQTSSTTKPPKPSLRLVPQHSRSRSAQDTTAPFEDSTSSSLHPSSTRSPTDYHLTSSKSLSPKKLYVPRSIPKTGEGGWSRRIHPRRHTTEIFQQDSAEAAPKRNVIPRPPGIVLGGGLTAAGFIPSASRNRENLNLPLDVDATVNRTQSVSTTRSGHKVLKTVTSLNEMVSLGHRKKGSRKGASDLESDSEIERISNIPQADRSQSEKDRMYRHIAAKISRLIKSLESDDGAVSSSNYTTPMDENAGLSGGSIPASAKSSSLERNSSFVSAKSSSTTSSHGHRETVELSSAGPGQAVGSYKMEDIPEGSRADSESLTETSVTKTNVSALGAILRNKGDNIHLYNPNFSAMFGNMMIQDLGTYEVFERMVDSANTDNTYLQKIVAVFSITAKVWKYAGKTGQLANQVKENALNYIENHVAQYIMGHGGWDSMLEESSSELEVD